MHWSVVAGLGAATDAPDMIVDHRFLFSAMRIRHDSDRPVRSLLLNLARLALSSSA